MMKNFVVLLAFSAFAASACKPAGSSGSEVQSLDNFTRADGAAVKKNQCGLKLTEAAFAKLSAKDQKALSYVDAPSRELALDALGAMAAVPRPLLSLFFKLDGKVRVVKDVAAACSAAKLSPAEKKFAAEGAGSPDGCWNVDGKRFEVIVKADHASIHHAMVRIFGYVYVQFVPGFAFPDQSVVARLKKSKQAIGDALLADAARKGEKSARFAQFAASPQYDDFAVAEAIDSYYCSKVTRQTFANQFPETFKAFTAKASLQDDLGDAFYE